MHRSISFEIIGCLCLLFMQSDVIEWPKDRCALGIKFVKFVKYLIIHVNSIPLNNVGNVVSLTRYSINILLDGEYHLHVDVAQKQALVLYYLSFYLV